MLGAGTAGLATPFALAYALHVRRAGGSPLLGGLALGIAALEALAGLALGAAWLWNFVG